MKIIINIKGKPQTLTLEEARELYNDLDIIFKNKKTEYVPYYPYYPYWPTVQPNITRDDWYITVGNTRMINE